MICGREVRLKEWVIALCGLQSLCPVFIEPAWPRYDDLRCAVREDLIGDVVDLKDALSLQLAGVKTPLLSLQEHSRCLPNAARPEPRKPRAFATSTPSPTPP